MYALGNHNGAKHDHYQARIALVLLPTSAYRCIGPSPTTSSRRPLVRHITVLHFFLFLLLTFYFHTLVVTVPRSLVRILARMDTHHALFFLVKHVRHIECTIRVWPHKISLIKQVKSSKYVARDNLVPNHTSELASRMER